MLRASNSWSFDAREPAKRSVLRRLAVFRASYGLDAAETVGADGAWGDSLCSMW